MITSTNALLTLPTEKEIHRHLRRMQNSPYLTIDTEGELTHPFSTTWGFSYSVDGVSEYFPFFHISGDNLDLRYLDMFRKVIENHPCLVFHHAKHDLRALRSLGINISRKAKWYCTMLMSHMTNENLFAQGLDSVSVYYGGKPKEMHPAMAEIIKRMGWRYVPSWMFKSYAGNDAFITEELFHKLLPDFQAQRFDGELWDVERDFTWLLADMEDLGILIDTALSERELERGLGIMESLTHQLGFNPASSQQLGNFLITELKMPMVRPTKTTKNKPLDQQKPSFDKFAMEVYDELLQQRNDDRARQILTYRGWQKTTSSNYLPYLTLLGEDGRLRCSYKQHGTKTGRLSCEHPNLQQIPKQSPKDWNGQLKRVFITDPGRTAWEFDYAQLELRLGAAVGKVTKLLEIFADDERDVFSEMANELGMQRDPTKTLNYTIQFGGGVTRVSEVFGVSRLAARAIIDNYYAKFPGLRRATRRAARLVLKDGFIRYWSGRRRHFWNPAEDARKAFNAYCQGGGFEIVKRRMLALQKEGLLNSECRLDLQVHDSVRLDIEDGKEDIYIPEVKRVLEDVKPDFGVKFRVSVKKWGEK
jgi:DNA polymerase I